MLSSIQLSQKIKEVPVIELSYENSTSHNKVCDSYQIVLAIPRSKKYIAWFTFFEEHDICILLELNREKQIVSYRQINVLFDTQEPHLALGTFLYGSMVHEIENDIKCSFFVIEDILIYRGVSLRKLTFGDRLGIIYHILHKPNFSGDEATFGVSSEEATRYESHQSTFCAQGLRPSLGVSGHLSTVLTDVNASDQEASVLFRLPVMFSSKQTDISIWSETYYKIHHLQFRSLTKIIPYLNQPYTTNPYIGLWNQPLEIKQDASVTFTTNKISKPPVTNLPNSSGGRSLYSNNYDLKVSSSARSLSCPQHIEPVGNQRTSFFVTADLQSDIYHLVDPKSIYKVDFAYIPNYKTSVFMNSLFRNIKENMNIDAIEDSDDDEDFYDTRYDKYVDLKKRLLMECIYHKKFKRWVPFRNITNTNINT
jgi:hypothetical protein